MRRFLQEHVVRAEQMLGAPTFAEVSEGIEPWKNQFVTTFSRLRIFLSHTQGSLLRSQPWAGGLNPFGIGENVTGKSQPRKYWSRRDRRDTGMRSTKMFDSVQLFLGLKIIKAAITAPIKTVPPPI